FRSRRGRAGVPAEVDRAGPGRGGATSPARRAPNDLAKAGLRPGAMENRERELQRAEKPRLRARTQFRARPEVSRHDARGSQSARLRLAHRAGTAGAALAAA